MKTAKGAVLEGEVMTIEITTEKVIGAIFGVGYHPIQP